MIETLLSYRGIKLTLETHSKDNSWVVEVMVPKGTSMQASTEIYGSEAEALKSGIKTLNTLLHEQNNRQ